MSKLPDATLVRTNQLHANQSDIVAHMVYKILRRLIFRVGRQLIIIHLPAMLPVHPKDELLCLKANKV